MDDLTVRDIVEEALKAGGYDGLVSNDCDCACQCGNLFPCCEPADTCRAGYLVEPSDEQRAEGSTWAIAPGKKEEGR